MSKLRAKKPTTIEKRFKALFYGAAGVGKTTAAIQFPKPYLIDTERGAENDTYTKLLEDNGGVIFQTNDCDEILSEINSLLTEEHEYKTLIIDPLTTIYHDLLENASEKVGTEFGRHYGEANKKIKRLLNMLIRLDMNVIITSHAKNLYSPGDSMSIIGQTYDCYKKLDYLFDLVIQIEDRGGERIGKIEKTRIETFPKGEVFPFSYKEIAKRYGTKILEKKAVAQALATSSQVTNLKSLIDIMKISDETQNKWLKKSQSTCFEEMEASQIQACIDSLEDKLNSLKSEKNN